MTPFYNTVDVMDWFSFDRAADLLLGGAVMNKSFQPHESHISFPLHVISKWF